MIAMGQGTETCTDRPTEVSVIRFVSRNRTIEEIAPKKEVYMCKERGCGKKFTNQDEYKTHETLEALKIRFICREPGCGEELSDPGSMWRHYQEWHNNETSVFVCPYTSCSSVHTTSENLEEHIETCHRQPPTLPTEPEIICFEGPENTINEEITRSKENEYFENDTKETKKGLFSTRNESFAPNDYSNKDGVRNVLSAKAAKVVQNNESVDNVNPSFPKNDDLLITKENFLIKYETISAKSNETFQMESNQEKVNVVFVNADVTITKNSKNESSNFNKQSQEQRVDIENLERVFRSDFDASKTEDHLVEGSNNCSEDEEYTPKKQRMSRHKQESHKCDVGGCGKMYKYISTYRHHQDSHKLQANTVNANTAKSQKPKQRKTSTVSFFLCKMPGCGAQVDNVTSLWKHYQDNHANSKLPGDQVAKNSESFRCNVPGCDMEFGTNFMLYKHFNELHTNSMNNASTNAKTGNGGSIHFVNHMFHDDATSPQINFKTDFNAKHNDNATDYTESDNEKTLPLIVKEELRD